MPPFFSIILPTKNRSFLVGGAIQSVLKQTFADWELVVADNDDTQATQQVVSEYPDPRIRYFRTGNLSMPDNWEFGCSQAAGEYITILEDKAALTSRALARVFILTETDRQPVLSWRPNVIDERGQMQDSSPMDRGPFEYTLIPSAEILRIFLSGYRSKMMPRGLNSLTHRRIVQQIRSGPLGRLCLPAAPDYTMAYAQLAYADHVAGLSHSLNVFGHPLRYSNGYSFMVKGELAKQFIREVGGEANLYDRVPVKTGWILANTLYNDYVRVQSTLGARLKDFPLSRVGYFVGCYRDIQNRKEAGVDMHEQEHAWRLALAKESPRVKLKVYAILARQFLPQSSVGRRLGLDKLKNTLHRLRNPQTIAPPADSPPVFANVLEYVEWEERQAGD